LATPESGKPGDPKPNDSAFSNSTLSLNQSWNVPDYIQWELWTLHHVQSLQQMNGIS
jgi:hypothetical protein